MRWVRGHWHAFWFAPVRPTNLGVWRLIFYGSTFLFYASRDFSGWADVPEVFWHPFRVFGVVHPIVLPAAILAVLQVIWKTALVFSCIGLFTRPSTLVSFGLGLYLIGLPHNFGKVHHGDALVVFIMGILACSRCGDAWSIDRLVRLARSPAREALRPPSSGEYTWPIRLTWVLMTLVFLGAGTSKIRYSGWQWITSDNMANMLVNHHYTHRPLTRWSLYLAQHHWMTSMMAGMTVVMETAAPLAIFSRWARVVLVPSLFLMQAGIWVLMGIAFREFLVLYLVWVPWDRIGDWLNKRASIRPAYAILYDGSCGVCQATIRVVRSLDLLGRVHGYDVHGDWDDIARRYPALTQHACLEHMHVITPTGRRRAGFEAYRALAWAIPVGWLALPLLYLPGARVLGRRVYSAVASRRSCPLDGRLEHSHASLSRDRGDSQTALRQ